MPEVYRLDRVKVEKYWKTDAGALVAPVRFTRTGIFIYRNADGSERKEFRPPQEVFNPESLSTLEGAPVTVGHPGVVTSGNWAALSKGHVREAKQDGDYVAGTVRVDAVDAVAGLESGTLSEVSCGYRCEFDPTPGVYKGEKYDGIQRNIRYNHLALLSGEGRAGPECRVMLDGKDYDISAPTLENKSMDPKELEKAIERAVQAEAKAKAAEARADALEGERDVLKSQVEKLEGERLDESDVAARVDARVELLTVAKTVIKDLDPKGKSDAEIKKAVIAKVEPSLKLDGKSDEYVSAVYDLVASKVDKGGANTAAALGALETARSDSNVGAKPSAIADARKRQAERTKANNARLAAGKPIKGTFGVSGERLNK